MIYENGDLTDEAKRAKSIRVYNGMSYLTPNMLDNDKRYAFSKALEARGKDAFGTNLSYFGRSMRVCEVVYSVLLEVLDDPEKIYSFCMKWVIGMVKSHKADNSMSSDSKKHMARGIDARNAESYEACLGIWAGMIGSGVIEPDDSPDSRIMSAIEFNLIDRECQQKLSEAFLIGLYISSVLLDIELVSAVFEEYYETNDELKVMSSIKFMLTDRS